MEIHHTLRPTGINTRDTWYKSKEQDFSDVRICPDGYGIVFKALREPQFELRWHNG